MWTAAELASEARPAHGEIWRCVEHQHTIATRKLADSIEDSDILEDILDESKPPYPAGTEHLHYLLKTPFRYQPPHPMGSRFRREYAPYGIFYASEAIVTAMAELGHWRSEFFKRSPGTKLPGNAEALTVFSVTYASQSAIDLTCAPLNKDETDWKHPTDYSKTQQLADTAREANIESIRYHSVRDPADGVNVALLQPGAFESTEPVQRQTWYIHLTACQVEFTRASGNERFVFDRVL